jgi:lipopolysaccharide/colanic/teichoic acid biosynthesis glycosyltransferase/O-antigen/teichoic acid export membrane protein
MTITLPRAPTRGATAPGTPREHGGEEREGRVGRKPPRGSAERAAVCTLTAAVIFQPMLHPTGPKNSSPVDIFLIASIVTAAIWAAVTHRKLRAPYFFPVALYMAAGAASGLVSPLPGTALSTLMKDALLFAWCLAAVSVLSVPWAMRLALRAWSWSGICWAAVVAAAWAGHITALEGLTAAEGNRVMFTFGDPNYASWYWDATIFVVYAARTPPKRWMRIAGYGLLLWALILSESNGGMLALAGGIAFLAMLRIYRHRGWPGVVAFGLAIGLAASMFLTALPAIRRWAASSGQPLLVNSIGRSAQSSSERTQLIKETIELYQRSDGVLGLGPASTKPLLAQWLYPYANEAHDDYLAALVERGALGLFAFLLLAACAAARASPVVRRPLSPPFAAAVPRPAGIVAALLVLGANSFYEEVQDVRFLWLLLGVVAVLGWDASRQARHPPGGSGTASPGGGRGWGPGERGGQGGQAGPAPESLLSRALPARLPPGLPGGSSPGLPAGRARRPRRLGSTVVSRHALSNLGAQVGALAAVSAASLLVARTGGPAVVGEYTLLRVLPWLFGVVFSCGLPTASAFFLADQRTDDRRLRPTLTVMAVAGAALGGLAWLAAAVPFHHVFFRQIPAWLVAVTAVLVVTQLWTVTAKGCCQGSGDMAGANLVIVAEELWFVGVYPAALLLFGYHKTASVAGALIVSGIAATATGVARLWWRRFFTGWGLPSRGLATRVAAFGARGQLGNMLWLTNLRFDVILLGALAGPAVTGIYSVASKVAELTRLAPTAINYVLYPRFARLGHGAAMAEARRLLPRSTLLTVALTPVAAVAAYIGLPVLYGHAFDGAIPLAEIIMIGLTVEGGAAVASALLVGRGRPGLNSVGMGAGAVITVTLDVILIPRYGALGGAVTSAVTYLAATTTLSFLARRMIRAAEPAGQAAGPALAARKYAPAHAALSRPHPGACTGPGADSALRRAVDILVSGSALAILLPALLLIAAAVRVSGRGPVFYRQARAGRSGRPFTILKFRSMRPGADRSGPLVTSRSDPRVTKLGALLRAAKLDELPQLINVLKGDMTLVGPRPEVPRFIPYYHEEELAVLSVRPGLTGPGQIFYTQVQQAGQDAAAAGDPELHYLNAELHPKLAIDLEYLRRRSLRSDLGIVVRTALIMARVGRRLPAAATGQDNGQP